ncbi:hypothetical protein [uncultured Akkermansia sp.]|uniref:hypothetical protein n=1 Tax=uncultured Akkermansia sp. TaxID=512294 RepID=UPI0026244A08|nr:hypothetical protein [uncultured Akkermansia sp.]
MEFHPFLNEFGIQRQRKIIKWEKRKPVTVFFPPVLTGGQDKFSLSIFYEHAGKKTISRFILFS